MGEINGFIPARLVPTHNYFLTLSWFRLQKVTALGFFQLFFKIKIWGQKKKEEEKKMVVDRQTDREIKCLSGKTLEIHFARQRHFFFLGPPFPDPVRFRALVQSALPCFQIRLSAAK